MKLTDLNDVADLSNIRERFQEDLELFLKDDTTVYITGQYKDDKKSFTRNAVVKPVEGDMLAELLKNTAVTYLKDAIKQLEVALTELGVVVDED